MGYFSGLPNGFNVYVKSLLTGFNLEKHRETCLKNRRKRKSKK